MQFSVMSRSKAKSLSYKSLDKKTVIISITDVSSNPVVFAKNTNLIGICRVQFDDVEKGEACCIAENDAKKIIDFMQKYKDRAEHIVVHCEAGVSRSAGVCAAIMQILTNDDSAIFDNPKLCPNMSCYRTVLDAYHGPLAISEEEILKKEARNIEAWKRANDEDIEK